MNNTQKQNIFLALKQAKASKFLLPNDIIELANILTLDIKIIKKIIYFNGHNKKLDFIEGTKIRGIWTPSFWVWFLSTFIEIDTDTIIIDSDLAALEYCRIIFKKYMDHHSNHQ